ncbi:ABC transporter ATP-binding protein [Rhodobacter capsulatus]|uniref:ABC transporter ATP-binding protein n=1 Tax=Rhodobacter capsulatus TaxID=1061 RepID=UPI0006DCB2E6|nr:ABC transporter ATP-binding protein [Rhodobacter capsulatus]KQB11453.1 ABC transporter ATP-binding protein [Rhodobacter capsulatus]KQB12306.1 ABC transporter ATP-binding protein [Rhodobacter capsulatus]PZX25834.1 putative ABC transport system ATP-binding protein [Rhodobacter capsulatus]QNR64134.1 ABC transporter ATP-binding protein [Rhodobacter capsulatus]
MITLHGVSKTYNEGRPNEVTALRGIDLAIAPGVTVLMGPSGSGKTTLLSLVGCMARPTTGRITLAGEVISSLPERFLTDLRRRRFGFVFQRFNLIRGLSVLENVVLPAAPLGAPRAEVEARALSRLEALGLAGKARMPVEVLSGGETQRAAIARALVNDAPVLIADEPTANLDTALAHRFLDIVAGLRAEGKTVILTSHDPRIISAAPVTAVVELRDGAILQVRS